VTSLGIINDNAITLAVEHNNDLRFEQLAFINNDSFLSLHILNHQMIILDVNFHRVGFVAVEIVEVDDFLVAVDHPDLDAVYNFLHLDSAGKFEQEVLSLVFLLA
jgi:hypothetical protein